MAAMRRLFFEKTIVLNVPCSSSLIEKGERCFCTPPKKKELKELIYWDSLKLILSNTEEGAVGSLGPVSPTATGRTGVRAVDEREGVQHKEGDPQEKLGKQHPHFPHESPLMPLQEGRHDPPQLEGEGEA